MSPSTKLKVSICLDHFAICYIIFTAHTTGITALTCRECSDGQAYVPIRLVFYFMCFCVTVVIS